MDTTKVFKEQLKQLDILSDADVNLIRSYFTPQKLKQNEFFLKTGERCSKLGFLESGIMRTFVYDLEGEEVVKYFIDENILFTDIECYENSTLAKLNIQAITDCQILIITKRDNELLQSQLPQWDSIQKQFATTALAKMINKQNFLRIGSAVDQYKYFTEHFPNLAQNVPLKHIASYLGITQSSLSRLRKEWIKNS